MVEPREVEGIERVVVEGLADPGGLMEELFEEAPRLPDGEMA